MKTSTVLLLVLAGSAISTGCTATVSEETTHATEAPLTGPGSGATPQPGPGDAPDCGAPPKDMPLRFNSIGYGTPSNPFQIWNATQLRDLARDSRTCGDDCVSLSGATFLQCADINMAYERGFAIQWFKGTYDGGHHTLSNLDVGANGDHAGFFAFARNSTVRDLTFVSPTAFGTDEVTSLGVLAGSFYSGTVSGVTVSHPIVRGDLQAHANAGAIIGQSVESRLERLSVYGGSVRGWHAGVLGGGSNVTLDRVVGDELAVETTLDGGIVAGYLFDATVQTSYGRGTIMGVGGAPAETQCGGLVGDLGNGTLIDSKAINVSTTCGVAGGAVGIARIGSHVSAVTTQGAAINGGLMAGGLVGFLGDGGRIESSRVVRASLQADFAGGVAAQIDPTAEVSRVVVSDLRSSATFGAGGAIGASHGGRIEDVSVVGLASGHSAGGILGFGSIAAKRVAARVNVQAQNYAGGLSGSSELPGDFDQSVAFRGGVDGPSAGPVLAIAVPLSGQAYYEDGYPCIGANCNNAGFSKPLAQLLDVSQAPLNTWNFGSVWTFGADGYPTVGGAGAHW